MKANILVRAARTNDASVLSDVAFRSKAYWGYSDEFMEACREELTVPEAKLNDPVFTHYVGEISGNTAGYYAIEKITSQHVDLHALFIDPDYIGQGCGRCLMHHAMEQARTMGAAKMSVQSDPQAAAFYLAMGAVKVGESESGSVPGRYLPEMELSL